jgi:hypothetical protein
VANYFAACTNLATLAIVAVVLRMGMTAEGPPQRDPGAPLPQLADDLTSRWNRARRPLAARSRQDRRAWGARRPDQLAPVKDVMGWTLDRSAMREIDRILAETIIGIAGTLDQQLAVEDHRVWDPLSREGPSNVEDDFEST